MPGKKRKILIAVDGSERAFESVKYVANFKPFQGWKVVLFNVFTEVPKYYQDLEKDPLFTKSASEVRVWAASQKKLIREFMEKAEAELVRGGFQEKKVSVNVHSRKVGIARDIVYEAQNEYSLVVGARKGMTRIKEIALGSIANKLVEKITFIPLILIGNQQPNDKILIAVDGSEGSRNALDFTGKLLKGFEYPIELLHIIRDSTDAQFGFQKFFISKDAEKRAEEYAEAIFEDAIGRLMAEGINESNISKKTIKNTSRAVSIVHEAQGENYGTIVLGRRGLSKVGDFFLGRVSNKVIQMARKRTVWLVSG